MVSSAPGLKDFSFSSPVVIENYFRSWGGASGTYFLQLVDKGLRETGLAPESLKPLSTLAEMPLIKSFMIRFPSSSPQSLQIFYENAERAQVHINTLRHRTPGVKQAIDERV